MGWPIGHSLSPRLHGFWLRHYGIAGSYTALPVRPEDLESALRGLKARGFRGVNLTVPHKVAACGIVDTLDEAARRIGAANTIVVKGDGTLQGFNTDAYGFAANLAAGGFRPAGGTAFVIGAGGACRAVLVALQDRGMRGLTLVNRTRATAEALAAELGTASCPIAVADWGTAPAALGEADLLVNTTSLGMTGQPPLDFPLEALAPHATVTDIVYAPLETDLLRRARARGLVVIDGLGMLLHQARPAFHAFFGVDPEVTPALRAYVLEGAEGS